MADTAHTDDAENSATSRQIRVFLSSTFRDFMEERDLLVKQVFPSLRRRAQERGVEVVDVDLRWGVTQEESEQGKVIGICLAEIERCRPYFIGMLGERYGWTPGKTDYPDELFEKEQLGWIRDHQGNASVTELEILHGVLNDKEMAGRAFFYFRDPAWSRAQSEPGFVCDTTEEEAKLASLKNRIRKSGFLVAEDLPDPKAIADQIEADLWVLIEELYPDLDTADALEREERKHASYRQSRIGVYLGDAYVRQLAGLIQANEKKILITGESGFGKSALIANWMAAHQASQPEDVLFAHHLGCSNDANAIRPLLARMLDTASRLLVEHELIREPIKVPQDWWEMTAKLAETLQDLSRWCKATGQRWIWVLDGLDRLDAEDQQALPWLPLLIPYGVYVVISALDCSARMILQERQFHTLEIGLLKHQEQVALIDQFLQRYTKKLTSECREQILSCEQARSPLFLKVLLEELRQCGRYETLKEQIEGYIRPNADGGLGVDDLYERVLERLENDFGREEVRQVMTALWASRAGLSECELLGITGLTPLQWAPIDLALEKSFSLNENQVVFDHGFLRKAVHDRYLSSDMSKRNSYCANAKYFFDHGPYNDRTYKELPWNWIHACDWQSMWYLFSCPRFLIATYNSCGEADVAELWRASKKYIRIVHAEVTGEALENLSLAELIETSIEEDIEQFKSEPESEALLIGYLSGIANLCELIDITGYVPMKARVLAFEVSQNSENEDERQTLNLLGKGINTLIENSDYLQAQKLSDYQVSRLSQIYGTNSIQVLDALNSRFTIAQHMEESGHMTEICEQISLIANSLFDKQHPRFIDVEYQHGVVVFNEGKYDEVIAKVEALIESSSFLGEDNDRKSSLMTLLAQSYGMLKKLDKAEALIQRSLALCRERYGSQHPSLIHPKSILASVYATQNKYDLAKSIYHRCLGHSRSLHGERHIQTITLYAQMADLYGKLGELEESESLHRRCLIGQEDTLGTEHASTLATVYDLAGVLSAQKRYCEAIPLRRRELAWCRQQNGDTDPGTLTSINDLALDLCETGELEEAEALFRELLEARQQVLKPSDFGIGLALRGLAETLEMAGNLEEAAAFAQQALDHRLEHEGPDAWWTNRVRLDLARMLRKLGRYAESLSLLDQLELSMKGIVEPDDSDTGLQEETEALRRGLETSSS